MMKKTGTVIVVSNSSSEYEIIRRLSESIRVRVW